MKSKRAAALLLALVLCLGLLPTTALARGASVNWNVSGYPIGVGEDEEDGEGETSFTITFDANGGKFTDGSVTKDIHTWSGGYISSYPGDVTREGYTFVDWGGMNYEQLKYHIFTADTTVKATWKPAETPSDTPFIKLDPNGGACSVETVELNVTDHTAPTLDTELPTPTRSGYTFNGWYSGAQKVAVGSVFSGGETVVAKWTKVRTSKTTPSLKVVPDKIEAGEGKVEILLSCATDDAALDWRPLERALYGGGTPSDAESAVKSYISGKFSAVGLRLTAVKYQYDIPVNDSAYPHELYPEGVYPTTGLTLTLEGEARTGTLRIDLAPQLFVQLVDGDDDTVLDASSADIFNAAQVSIPVGTTNPNGPFTVKFDLNYKDPPEKEIPEPQKLSRGQTVDLPDGKKLTSPYSSHEFYCWCVLEGGKLYPWKETNPVTADMTLYAGWVKKGTVVKDGQALPDASAQTPAPAPSAPAKSPFTDVAATSPFAKAISWAVEKNITKGKTAATFGPGDPCTRAQIVTFLWRAAGSPEPKLTETQYMDVTDPNAYYYKAVQWAAEKDMEYAGTFDPHKTCDRASAVYFIWKAFGSSKAAAKSSFADMPETPAAGGQWYWPDLLDAVDWAVRQGVTTGKTADTFAPDDPCTRGHIVTFLYRAYEK